MTIQTQNSNIQLYIDGNVIVNNGASITVGTGNTNFNNWTPTTATAGGASPFINYYDQVTHRVVIFGNFTNNGTVRFTNQNYPDFGNFPLGGVNGSFGAATVYFEGSTFNTLTCNGQTDFYNLVLNKGVDQTYSLTINSPSYNNFPIFGANIAAYDLNGGATNANPDVHKALWIKSGTLILDGHVIIPSLTEGTTAGPPSSDYFIPGTGALELNDPNNIVLVTADDYGEVNVAYNVNGGTGLVNSVSQGGNQSLGISGKLIVNNGYLSTRESAGITYWSYNSGQIIINGGTVDTKQIHDATVSGVTGLVTYSQNSGNVLLRGRFQHPLNYSSIIHLTDTTLNTARAANSIDGTVGSFYINSNAANGYSMSGGSMFVFDDCGSVSPILSIPGNMPGSKYKCHGGSLQMIPTTGTVLADASYLINSLAPIANLTINRKSGAQIVQLNIHALTVLQNLNLNSGVFDANGNILSLMGNFNIASGTTYTNASNSTIFNGTNNQVFTVNLATPLTLWELIQNNTVDTLSFAGSQKAINITDSLMLISGKLNDSGDSLTVAGSIYNAGTHYGTGKIIMNSASDQTIGGNGSGVFNNLKLYNAAGTTVVTLTNNTSINGVLSFTGAGFKPLRINTYNLYFGASASITGINSNGNYIQCSDSAGDGGVTKLYSAADTTFTFALGARSVSRPAAWAYTPATISISPNPVTWGTITVIPVGVKQPDVTGANCLTYYWHVVSSGFTGLQNNSGNSFLYL